MTKQEVLSAIWRQILEAGRLGDHEALNNLVSSFVALQKAEPPPAVSEPTSDAKESLAPWFVEALQNFALALANNGVRRGSIEGVSVSRELGVRLCVPRGAVQVWTVLGYVTVEVP